MNKKYCVEVSSIFLLVCGFLVGTGTVAAQESHDATAREDEKKQEKNIPQGGLQISPTRFVWTLDEGDTKTGRIVVKNYSDKDQHVTLEIEDFYVKSDGRTPQIYTPDDDHELKALDVRDWVTPPDDFTIPAGGVQAVEFTVRVPDGQPTNGYYGTLLFRAGGGDSDITGSKIGISYRIGALLIMSVQGDAPMDKQGEIMDFYPEKNVFFTPPAVFYIKMQNTGNIHFPIFGTIKIERFGKKFHEIELEPRLIYPQKVVDFREIMTCGLWDFGKFDARVMMHSEDGSVQMEKMMSFWVIPWKGCAIVAGGCVGLMIVAVLFRRYVHIGIGDKKKKGKETQTQEKK